MASWCYTTYCFKGSKEELTTLCEKLVEWTKGAIGETDFGPTWLGNVLKGVGLGDAMNATNEDEYICARGSIEDINFTDGENLLVWTESAYSPLSKLWKAVIDKLGLNVTMSFSTEIPEDSEYAIYDPDGHNYFMDEVYIEASGTAVLKDLCDYYLAADAIDALNKFFETEHKSFGDFEPLVESYLLEHPGDTLKINVYKRYDTLTN